MKPMKTMKSIELRKVNKRFVLMKEFFLFGSLYIKLTKTKIY